MVYRVSPRPSWRSADVGFSQPSHEVVARGSKNLHVQVSPRAVVPDMHQSRSTLLAGFAPLLLLMSCGSSPSGPTPPSKPAALSSAISSTLASNDAANVTYTVMYTGTHQFYRVYLDTDRSAGTGYGYSGIGVEFLIENANLYKYTGSGSDWSWTAAGAVTFNKTGTQATWTVARSALGVTDPCAAAANVVFDIDDGTAPVMHQVLSPASTCATSTAKPAVTPTVPPAT